MPKHSQSTANPDLVFFQQLADKALAFTTPHYTVREITRLAEHDALGALRLCAGREDVPLDFVLKQAYSLPVHDDVYGAFVAGALEKRSDLTPEIIQQLWDKRLEPRHRGLGHVALRCSWGRQDVPMSLIREGLRDESRGLKYDAIKALYGRTDVPIQAIEEVLSDSPFVTKVHRRMVTYCYDEGVPRQVAKRWLTSDAPWLRVAALAVLARGRAPIEVLEQAAHDPVEVVRATAARLIAQS